MFRIITPIILIGISIAGFVSMVGPLYQDINDLRVTVSSYNQALDNSKSLENERDKLTKKHNSINLEDLDRLQKLLPDNVDNIRLILEIEKIASPYGMVLRDVRYNVEKDEDKKTTAVQGGAVAKPGNKDYGVWNLEFSTEGNYTNFLNFTRDLESNLRIVDIASIQFSSNAPQVKGSTSESYKYAFKIKTYWMKN